MLQGFHVHVKKEHNMWNYIYYSHYLDCIDTSDHTAIQKYVYNSVSVEHPSLLVHTSFANLHALFTVQIKKSRTGFFPKEKAMCLDSEDDNENEVQMEQIQEMVEGLLQRFRKKVSA